MKSMTPALLISKIEDQIARISGLKTEIEAAEMAPEELTLARENILQHGDYRDEAQVSRFNLIETQLKLIEPTMERLASSLHAAEDKAHDLIGLAGGFIAPVLEPLLQEYDRSVKASAYKAMADEKRVMSPKEEKWFVDNHVQNHPLRADVHRIVSISGSPRAGLGYPGKNSKYPLHFAVAALEMMVKKGEAVPSLQDFIDALKKVDGEIEKAS